MTSPASPPSAGAPLRVAASDHQGKARAIVAALAAAGHELVDDPARADVVLIDHDIPFAGKLPLVEACVGAGGRAFLYPHGTDPRMMANWDGLYPISPLLSGALMPAPGHAEVARRCGYHHPVYSIGWSLCELRERRATGRFDRVLFAPMHPPWADAQNTEIFEQLRAAGVDLTVRHLGSLEENLLPLRDDVTYVRGEISDFDEMVAQIDAADVVVAAGTFASIAVARGVTTVVWDSTWMRNNDASMDGVNLDEYCEYVRFPFEVEAGDLRDTMARAARDTTAVGEWRRRFVGERLDVDEIVRAFRTAPRRRSLPSPAKTAHGTAVAALENGNLAAADEILSEAVRAAFEPEALNDLAVIRSMRGDDVSALALLNVCVALAPDYADARENLDAVLARRAPAAA